MPSIACQAEAFTLDGALVVSLPKAPMLKHRKIRLNIAGRKLRDSFGRDISTPAGKRAAFWHLYLMDHGFLRMVWRNLAEIAPGAWRSNQPSPGQLRRHAAKGLRTVINLRGISSNSNYLLEAEACAELGLVLRSCPISARRLAPRGLLLDLLDAFETAERPLLIHCKSGADRAGLAAALYLMHVEGQSAALASRQLSFRFMHFRNDSTGVLDYMLDRYAADCAARPMPIREWIETVYDATELQIAFERERGLHDGR